MAQTVRKEDTSQSQNQQIPAGRGILERFFALLFESTDPEKHKKRLLKLIARDLVRLGKRYYNPRNEMVLSDFPQLIYETYKLLGPAQNLIKRAESSKALRNIVFEISLTETHREVLERLQDEAIRERSQNQNAESLAAEATETLSRFSSSFTPEMIKEIDGNYNDLSLFLDFIHFDYYFFLKKFSSNIIEHDFSHKYHFDSLSGEYVIDGLKDFNDLISGLNSQTNWDVIFEALKTYRKVEAIRKNVWEKAFRKLLDIRNTHVLDLIIKHVSKTSDYKSQPVVYNEKIGDAYLNSLKATVDSSLRQVSKETKHRRIEDLAKSVFGVAVVSGMDNYTEQENATFTRFGMPGFVHIEVMSYVGTFLKHYFKENLSQMIDLLLIKGKWVSKTHSQQISEAYHQLIRICETIFKFDLSLGEDEDLGRKLRNMIYRAENDKKLLVQIQQELMQINDNVKEYLVETAKSLIRVAKCLKQVHDDYDSQPHEIIVNWGEIDASTGSRTKAMMVEVYKKIYNFIQIIQYFHKK